MRVSRGGIAVSLWCIVALAPTALSEAQPSPEWIRVAVVRGAAQLNLQVHGAFTMDAIGTGDRIDEGSKLKLVQVQVTAKGLALGDRWISVSGVRIQPERDGTISLNGSRLRGMVEILRQDDATLLAVNHVALEDYLRGVLSKEAPDYWPEEALNSIAIAARTYALYQRISKATEPYDLTGDVMSQDYGGKSSEKRATDRAVTATAGLILMANDQLFPTFYHSTCGGMIENGRAMGAFDIEPLRGGIVCHFCTASPFYTWRRRLSQEDFNWVLHKSPKYESVGTIKDVRILSRTPSGRVKQLAIIGAKGTVKLTGYELRALLGFERIRSAMFTIVRVGNSFVLDGRGWGHGVGMCQWGAAELARRGMSATDILTYYYPSTSVVQIQEIAHRPINLLGGDR